METSVHPTAIIEKGAELDQGVSVGAYAYIGPYAENWFWNTGYAPRDSRWKDRARKSQ